MADIQIVWDTVNARGDWALAVQPQGLVFSGTGPITFRGSAAIQFVSSAASSTGVISGEDLETAVLISLFTDRLAETSDLIPDGTTDRRGWWGDAGQDYPIGSRLWLLTRAKQIPQTLLDAQGYCSEALQWMIDDGVAASITVACSFPSTGTLGVVINLFENSGNQIAKYQWAWKGLN